MVAHTDGILWYPSGMRDILHSQLLSTNGDGTGTSNFIGNYAVTAVDGLIRPPSGKTFTVARVLLSIKDTAGFQQQEYGNLGSALSNGLEIIVENTRGEQFSDLTAGLPITTNGDWARQCYDVDVKTWGSGNEMLVGRYTFAKHGAPIRLKNDDQLRITFNDNFTGLISHHFLFEGLLS